MADATSNRKRKRAVNMNYNTASKGVSITYPEHDEGSDILLLETKIVESRKHYNDITTLIGYLHNNNDETQSLAAVALCRVFCRLLAAGALTKSNESSNDGSSQSDRTICRWLLERLNETHTQLFQMLKEDDPTKQATTLTISMQLLREQAKHYHQSNHVEWSRNAFQNMIETLIAEGTPFTAAEAFAEMFASKYDDVRYYTFDRITELLSSEVSEARVELVISMLALLEPPNLDGDNFPQRFLGSPLKSNKKNDVSSRNAYLTQMQKVWMAVITQKPTKAQRKRILESMSTHIAPCFLQVELLMDFLTDSFNIGGSTSLLALSGMFYMIQKRNLDYPQFYHKLYAMVDGSILHSKHRSRFFRLLDTFLASTHLPAVLVASFIKRLSRLCLFAPPAGIVVVVPLIYNLLKTHPTCTFMIHRNSDLSYKDEDGWGDPFRMEEPDPMETDAIESSLWEIETLQSHYHPNVATIAKIISEQFTKQAYNLEDFLDHTYGTMLDTELSKELKKEPEIEYEIPKKIFTKYDKAAGKDDSPLVKLWNFVESLPRVPDVLKQRDQL